MNNKQKILIISDYFDYHASSVKWGLEKLGATVDYWCIPDFTELQTISAYPSRENPLFIQGPSFKLTGLNYKSVWLRRGICPAISKNISELDAEYALRESKILLSGVLSILSEKCFSVNSIDSRQKYGNKLRQLTLANEVGFIIPDTIISNSPDEIRSFFNYHGGKIIFKPLSFANWITETGSAGIYTSRVDYDHLKDDLSISACPGIFQPEIDKKYELRVTVMGESIFAVELNTQAEKKSLDWRVDFKGNPPCRLYKLPREIEEKIRDFMRRSELVFGCIDFIVDNNGNYIFLEINEMGQFLWLDFAIPELSQFDAFCNFLLEGSSSFKYSNKKPRITIQEFDKYYSENTDYYKSIEDGHIPTPNTISIIESDKINKEILR